MLRRNSFAIPTWLLRMSTIYISIVGFLLMVGSCGQTGSQQQHAGNIQQRINDCDNPDADINCCFINMPAQLTSAMHIPTQNEPGEKLFISGIIYKADGKTPFPDVILYAYHTDHRGYYSRSGTETGAQRWHGRLHGWCKTDRNGAYRIHTIRPARYPDNTMPAHIHAAVKMSNAQMKWIADFVFKDDSLVNEEYLSRMDAGGTGVVDVKRTEDNSWAGRRDIILK